ncbi:MAG: hypothetical protein AB7T37_05785 [Dehalococcoidia bacterium]
MLSRISPRQLRRLAVTLLVLTLAYNVAEGAIAIVAGLRADSIVLLTFGADSYLEVLAASAVLWRLSFRDEESGERAERKAMRLIGASFLLLAAAVAVQAALAFAGDGQAESSPLGIGLLVASLVLMPLLSFAKLWTAARLRLPVIAAEARETIACSYLSLTALAGLAATAAIGAAWVDPFAALLLIPWLVREGLEGVRGDACFDGLGVCFCRQCLWGVRNCPPNDACVPRCC